MMMQRRIAIALAAACAAAAPAAAQQAPGPSVDVSVGLFTGAGGRYVDRGGPALDGIVAIPLRQTPSATVVAGLTAGISGPLMIGDQDCILGPDDSCLPAFPTFATLGAVAGVQRGLGARLSARMLAGPVYFYAPDGDDALGMQGRLDVARPLFFRTSVVASVRGSLLPSYQGETLRHASFGVGVRFQ